MCDPDETRARDLMGDRFHEYCVQRFWTFVDDTRFKDSRRAPGWANDEKITCAVIVPENVVEKWHVRIDDPELIAKARYFIKSAFPDGSRACSDDPRAVLVLCPVM